MELHTSTNTFGGDASTRKCRQKVGISFFFPLADLPIHIMHRIHSLKEHCMQKLRCTLDVHVCVYLIISESHPCSFLT